jgi:ribosomal-protein-alanine N-acetyltransferase
VSDFLLTPAVHGDAKVLAALHEKCFEVPWSTTEMRDLLAGPGVMAILGGTGAASPPMGFVMVRIASDEAEILSICVVPEGRGRGLGQRLLAAGLSAAAGAGASSVFLEVAASNDSAKALYAKAGFQPVGMRKGYYACAAGPAMDAVIMKLALSPP